MKSEFPYEEYKDTKIWNVIEFAGSNLVDNSGLEEKTDRRYIVVYLCKALDESGINMK
ncbi:hypothetical protein QA584_26405 [Anaerocolumna sp. AGMB13025]|uniref:hypothetical protein n=1 Tax=Anaerocolumna sp. AGMB13025 TaxID=3039116 RepID=UPI00241EBF95|nr:hypothetical protein [Anaerocolumna sp. AGMB13025]WFR57104.1 hypothetical protein QA584_26405 [Anaerocolumna sp. AGMB13025]